MMCLRIENFVRDFSLCPYMQFSERCFFFASALSFSMKNFKNGFPGHREDFLDDLYEEILFREKRSESSKLFFSEHHLFLRDKTLPSLVIIENADLRDATEWGALNRKSRLLCFARICNLLRGGKNSLFIEIQ